jgi:hypothetical protein
LRVPPEASKSDLAQDQSVGMRTLQESPPLATNLPSNRAGRPRIKTKTQIIQRVMELARRRGLRADTL